MKISVDSIAESPKEIKFAERIEGLNLIGGEDEVRDFCFPASVGVNLVYYRSGQELFFRGSLGGDIEGVCSRCLKRYSFPLEKRFEFILTPEPGSAKSRGLNRDELGLSFYAVEEINLSPYIREQLLLALPMRPLCEDDCRGLCVDCGANLNEESCRCASSSDDPRMAFFRTLKLGQ